MPPTKRNPAARKRPANARVGPYTRADGTKVKAHTRAVTAAEWAKKAWKSANATRIRRTATGTATAGTVCALIVAEAGFTIVSTFAMLAIAGLTTLGVWAGNIAEQNRKTLGGQARKRKTARRPRTGTRTGSTTRKPRSR
jgi:hypothetical protein